MLEQYCKGDCIDRIFLVVIEYGCEELITTYINRNSALLYAEEMRESFSVKSTVFERPLIYKCF